ncbi:MAG: hypothetical protein ACK559_06960, partial [bacterium]
IEIPLEISRSFKSDELISLLNTLIEKKMNYEDDFYRFSCVALKTKELELTRRFDLNSLKKQHDKPELEIYKLNDVNSNFMLIDKENSVFSDSFLKLTDPLPYNTKLMKWEFTSKHL